MLKFKCYKNRKTSLKMGRLKSFLELAENEDRVIKNNTVTNL